MLSFLLLLAIFGWTKCLRASPALSCKVTPLHSSWPSPRQWAALNDTLDGSLIATSPVASSCWNNTDFKSSTPCKEVSEQWTSSIFHLNQPESIDYPIFANNSCLPPGSDGYLVSQGCRLGGLPSYIVNATTEKQVATAMRWAANHNLRIVVKGTGHDLSGRSSGAYALSIWTHHFRHLERNPRWHVPGSQDVEDVFIVGSGLGWGDVLDEALSQGRVVTTGQDPSVGLGGYIQGGGHGPIASTYGLAAQQVLQMTVVTTKGDILTTNAVKNSDLFWALRGGGGGQYGVVTEYVIRHFPAPKTIVLGTLAMAPLNESGADASWEAAAKLFQALPDLMDAGLAGAMTIASGKTAQKFNPGVAGATTGAVLTQVFWTFNKTQAQVSDIVQPVLQSMQAVCNNRTLSVTFSSSPPSNYSSFYDSISGSNVAGGGGISSSRLLGRAQLDRVPTATLENYLRRALKAENATAGTYMTVGLSGGPGVIHTPPERWGALIPSWRSAYLHLIVGGASGQVDAQTSPATLLSRNADWIEEYKEKLWREWAPSMGAYMNEANPYDREWKKDYYHTTYNRLVAVKRKYDPTDSLYVLTGVSSDRWSYDLQTGLLCHSGK